VRPRLTGLLLAVMVAGALLQAACAHAQAASAFAASPFEVIPRRADQRPSHRLAWITAAVGAGLVAGSFPLAHEADRRYDRYLAETDVARIDERFAATTRMDRLASAALLTGEGLLATAVWLRFVHPAREPRRLSLEVEPSRCAVSLRF
jgi:hypothetical protein